MRLRLAPMLLLLSATMGVVAPVYAETKDDDFEQTDDLTVARMLFRDGFFDRAATVIERVDPQAEDVDAKEVWLLRGLIELNRRRFVEAAGHFGRAIESGHLAPKLHLLRAQALANGEELEAAEEVIRMAPASVRAMAESYLLHARILYQLEKKHASFEVLDQGLAAFPDNASIERQRVFLLMELGLYQTAQASMNTFFEHHGALQKDYVALAESLRKAGQLRRSQLLLEEANIRFPEDADIRTQLAVTYLDLGRPIVAAEVLRPLAWVDAGRAMHTAELYRKGGALGRATRMNERVVDQKGKIRQRLSLLLEQQAFERAVGLFPRVARLGLLDEQGIVYAMAYAFFKTRDFERAESLISQLTDEKLFEQGIAIRRAIEDCKRASWQCD